MTEQESAAKQAQQWFVRRGDKEHGPFTSKQLRSMAASGKITVDDLLRKGDTSKWIKAGSIKGLFVPNEDAQSHRATAVTPDQIASTSTSEMPAGTFSEWYKTLWVSRLPIAAQVGVWLLYGWIWMPALYLARTKSVSIAFKVIGCIVLLSLLLPAIRNAREAARQAESGHQQGTLSQSGRNGKQGNGTRMTVTGDWTSADEDSDPVEVRLKTTISDVGLPSGRLSIQKFVSDQVKSVGRSVTCHIPLDEWRKVEKVGIFTVEGTVSEEDGELVLLDCHLVTASPANATVSLQDRQYFYGYRNGVEIGLEKKRQYERETDPSIKMAMRDDLTQLVLHYHRQAKQMTSSGGQADELEGLGDGLRSGFYD